MAGGSGGNYRIVLQAQIDPKSIETQLNNIASSYIFKLNIQVNNQDVNAQLQRLANGLKESMGRIIDPNTISQDLLMPISAFEQRINQMKTDVQHQSKVDVSSYIDKDGLEQISRTTLAYTDQAGKRIQETWVPALKQVGDHLEQTGQMVLVNKRYVDDIAKAERLHQQEVDKTNRELAQQEKLYDRMMLDADKVLAKSGNENSARPEVQKNIELATQLKEELGDTFTQVTPKAEELHNQLVTNDAAVRALGKSTLSWGEETKIAFQRLVEWGIATGILYGGLAKIKEGVQYIIDLNKAMTDIRVVTGMTKDQTDSLANSYTSLASEMGATTLEVAQGSTEWFRQGKTVAETEELMRSSMMMSKLAAMDSADATTYLTSILNGFQMGADQATTAVDKLVNYIARTHSNMWAYISLKVTISVKVHS